MEQTTIQNNTLEKLVSAIFTMRDTYAQEKISRINDEIPDALLYDSSGWARSVHEQLNLRPAILIFGDRGDGDEIAIYNELLGDEANSEVRCFVITPDTKKIAGAKAEAQNELEELAELGEMGDLSDDMSNLGFNLEVDEEAIEVERYTTLSDVENNLARRMGLIAPLPDELIEIFAEITLPTAAESLLNMHDAPLKATFIVDSKSIIRYVYNAEAEPQQVIADYNHIK